ncbi:MAG: hypothetical protein ACLPZ0_04585 [Steroidobacteraceae bacterium]|jgi:hypothetical protein
MMSFKQFLYKTGFLKPRKVLVTLDDQDEQILNEATRATVGRYTARRDPPHFQGDEYHAHVDLPRGYQIGWGKSGQRRHEGKFPATIPKDARLAVAKVLGVDANLLEGYRWFDDVLREEVIIIAVKPRQNLHNPEDATRQR